MMDDVSIPPAGAGSLSEATIANLWQLHGDSPGAFAEAVLEEEARNRRSRAAAWDADLDARLSVANIARAAGCRILPIMKALAVRWPSLTINQRLDDEQVLLAIEAAATAFADRILSAVPRKADDPARAED